MKHHSPMFFRDDYGIGQEAVARIQEEVSTTQLQQCAAVVLKSSYVDPDYLAAHVRMLGENMAVYRRARDVQTLLRVGAVQ